MRSSSGASRSRRPPRGRVWEAGCSPSEAEARRAGLRHLRLFTNEMFTENLALYRRLGYHASGRQDYRGRVLVHLHKPLDEPSPELG